MVNRTVSHYTVIEKIGGGDDNSPPRFRPIPELAFTKPQCGHGILESVRPDLRGSNPT